MITTTPTDKEDAVEQTTEAMETPAHTAAAESYSIAPTPSVPTEESTYYNGSEETSAEMSLERNNDVTVITETEPFAETVQPTAVLDDAPPLLVEEEPPMEAELSVALVDEKEPQTNVEQHNGSSPSSYASFSPIPVRPDTFRGFSDDAAMTMLASDAIVPLSLPSKASLTDNDYSSSPSLQQSTVSTTESVNGEAPEETIDAEEGSTEIETATIAKAPALEEETNEAQIETDSPVKPDAVLEKETAEPPSAPKVVEQINNEATATTTVGTQPESLVVQDDNVENEAEAIQTAVMPSEAQVQAEPKEKDSVDETMTEPPKPAPRVVTSAKTLDQLALRSSKTFVKDLLHKFTTDDKGTHLDDEVDRVMKEAEEALLAAQLALTEVGDVAAASTTKAALKDVQKSTKPPGEVEKIAKTTGRFVKNLFRRITWDD